MPLALLSLEDEERLRFFSLTTVSAAIVEIEKKRKKREKCDFLSFFLLPSFFFFSNFHSLSLSLSLSTPAPPTLLLHLLLLPRLLGQAPLAPGQRWSVARKREVVLGLLRGESSELLSRELGVPIYKLEQWRQKADAALDGALKERDGDPAAGELASAMQRIGELSMEVELLRSRIERPGPLARRRSR